MNFIWKTIFNKSSANSSFSVMESNCNGKKVRAVIHVTSPVFYEQNKDIGKRTAFVQFFIKSNSITDGFFHDISDDIVDDLKASFKDLYGCIINQYYLVNRFPTFKPFTFGDYGTSSN